MSRKAVLVLILLCLSSHSGDPINIIARPGQTVVLPCQVPNDDPIIAVHWSRSDMNPIHVLLYRSKTSNPADQQQHSMNRVDLLDRQMKDGDLSLILKDVKLADSGTYECHVIQTGINHMKTPIMATEPITIIKLRVDPVDPINIIARPGQTVVLPCQVPNDDPIIAVHWSRSDMNPIHVLLYRSKTSNPADQQQHSMNRVDLLDRQMKDGDLSLILKDVKLADSGTYECHVIQTGINHMKTPIMATEPITIIKLRVDPVDGLTNDGLSNYVQDAYFQPLSLIFGLFLFFISMLLNHF